MTFTTEEILALVAVGVVLAIIVTAYMVISRRKGWMLARGVVTAPNFPPTDGARPMNRRCGQVR